MGADRIIVLDEGRVAGCGTHVAAEGLRSLPGNRVVAAVRGGDAMKGRESPVQAANRKKCKGTTCLHLLRYI